MRISRRNLRRLIQEELGSEAVSTQLPSTAIVPASVPSTTVAWEPPTKKEIIATKTAFETAFITANPGFQSQPPKTTMPVKLRDESAHGKDHEYTDAEIDDLIRNVPGYNLLEIIPAGKTNEDRYSNKYRTHFVRLSSDDPTRELNSKADIPVVIVPQHGNKGERFERELELSLLSTSQQSNLESVNYELGTGFLQAVSDALPFDVTRRDISSIVRHGGSEKRTLGASPQDVGEAISDITITIEKDGTRIPMYISLKDPKGLTFGNHGLAGSFALDEEGFVVSSSSSNSIMDGYIESLGFDKALIAKGATDAKRGWVPTKQNVVNPIHTPGHTSEFPLCQDEKEDTPVYNFDAQALHNYIAGALGYGYIYARLIDKAGGYGAENWHIEHLETVEDTKHWIGMPSNVFLKYPRYCGPGDASKQASAKVFTHNGAAFVVTIRNKNEGKFMPNQIMTSFATGTWGIPITKRVSKNRTKKVRGPRQSAYSAVPVKDIDSDAGRALSYGANLMATMTPEERQQAAEFPNETRIRETKIYDLLFDD